MKNRVVFLSLLSLLLFLGPPSQASPVIFDQPITILDSYDVPGLAFIKADVAIVAVENTFIVPCMETLEKAQLTLFTIPKPEVRSRKGSVFGKQGNAYFILARNSLNRQELHTFADTKRQHRIRPERRSARVKG